jgi:phage terminase large subunit
MKMARTKNDFRSSVRSSIGPVRFARVVVGGDLWRAQREILAAVARYKRVAVKSCHASGKTYDIALAVIWWLIAHPDGIVVTTAPTWLQVEKVVWGEIRKILTQVQLRGLIRIPRPQQTELRIGPGNYAIGLSTDDSSRFQGFHSGHVLVVLDEAPGVRADIYEAIEGIRAGGEVHVLAIGNPTIASGPFYSAFTTERASWRTFTISAFDTPNLQGLSLAELRELPPNLPEDHPIFAYQPRPYLVTRRWVYEKFWEWGEDSPEWQTRVTGNFSELSQNSLIALRYLEQARAAKCSPGDERELFAGIDVADAGDSETVCVVMTRIGSIVAMGSWHGDSRGRVIEFLSRFKKRVVKINYDEAGIGAYFAKDFRNFGLAAATGVNVGKASKYPMRFRNLKAQLYWALREAFERGDISGLVDEVLISQLSSIRYDINSRGQIEIESKQERLRRGAKSPDRAEALMLAFADLTPGIIEFYRRKVENGGDGGNYPSGESRSGEDLIKVYQQIAERCRAARNGQQPAFEISEADGDAEGQDPDFQAQDPISIEQEMERIGLKIDECQLGIGSKDKLDEYAQWRLTRLRILLCLANAWPASCSLAQIIEANGTELHVKAALETLEQERMIERLQPDHWKYRKQGAEMAF